LPLQLDSKIPIAHQAEVLKMLLRSSGVELAQIGNSESSGEEQFLSSTHIASIRFSCGRHVKYVLTRANDSSVIIGTWFEPVYGKIHLKKAMRNFLDTFNWPSSKSARKVHRQAFHSYLTTDFRHILVQPPPLKRWTWEKPAVLCSSCNRLIRGY
jgi:hypothetical protein